MGAAAQLLITRDGEVVKKQNLDGEVDVGRAEGCVIRLEDRAISRQHALFRPVGDGFQVEKKSEFGPLTVNGAECTRAFLKEGDVISIGPYLVKYQAGAGATAASAPVPTDTVPIGALDVPHLTPLVPEVEAVTQAIPSQSQAQLSAASSMSPTAAAAAAFAAEMSSPAIGMPDLGGLDPLAPPSETLAPTAPVTPSNDGSLLLDAPLSMEPSSSMAPPVQGVQSVEGGPVGGVGDLSLSLDPSGPKLEAGTASGLTTGPVDQDAATKVLNSGDLKAKLLLKSGVASTTEFEFENKEEISIGRGRDCEIIVDDKKVSRKNTIIRREGNKYLIKDLESANGTFVNGAQVKEMQLYGEDIVKIGNTEFKFVALSENYAKREQEFSEIAAAAAAGAAPAISLAAPGEMTGGGEVPGELQIPEINLPPPIDGGGQRPLQSSSEPLQIPTPSQLLSMPPLADQSMMPQSLPPPAPGMTGGMFNPGMPSGMPSMGEKTINVLGIPGLPGAIPGVTGAGKQDKGLMAKFRRLPKRMQWIVILVVIAGCWTLLWDDDEFNIEKPTKTRPQPKVSAKPVDPVSPTFDNLSPEKKRFVVAQHDLAFDYYRNKDYGRALYEIQKIFDIIPDYKDSREIERYSKEGKRKQDAQEEERRKKEEEARLKAKVSQLVDEARLRMNKKQYEQAREIFPKILALDPDNVQVSGWKKDIEDWEEKQKLADQEKQIQKEINDRAWGIYKRGLALKRQRRYHTAIVIFGKLVEDGTSDRKLIYLAKKQIASSRALITARRKPVYAAAAAAEKNGEFAKAMRLYSRAAAIDPSFGASAAGLARVKKVLHDRAKVIYTEAVLAESYSDFDTAKAKYKEILSFSPEDDIYYERAQRKIGRYFQRGVAQE